MNRDFAFVQTGSDRVFVGWGPFEQLPFRRPEQPAFFIADFFLDDPHPWRHPATWEELSRAEFAYRFEEAVQPSVQWESNGAESFRALFDSARERFGEGAFRKIVPVVFEEGTFEGDLVPWLVRRIPSLPDGVSAYGYSYHGHGVVGATPEILFRAHTRMYETMALAGTRPLARADELLVDQKELREHRVVVDDIARRLAPFGNVEIGPIGILRLPTLAHLMTRIFFAEIGTERMHFTEMVRRLHPTAALGVAPRNESGERWLREADRGIRRRTFGAPFGVELPDRSALALVAIRNVQWNAGRIRIGSGAGLLPESRLDLELDELRHKRDQVKLLFGVGVMAASGHAVAS